MDLAQNEGTTTTTTTKVPLKFHEQVKLNNLLDWLERQGGKLHHHVYFAKDEQMGISGFAKDVIEAESVIATVPVKACITTCQAKSRVKELFVFANSQESPVQSEDELNAKDWIILYIVLHKLLFNPDVERARNGDSNDEKSMKKRRKVELGKRERFLYHQDYVNLLPTSVLTPMHFNFEGLELLRNTPLFTHAIRRRKETRETCEKVAKYVLQSLKGCSEEEEWIDTLMETIRIPDQFTKIRQDYAHELTDQRGKWRNETGEDFLWDEDEELWPFLRIWRWAETAHGSRAFPPKLIQDLDSAPVLLPCYDLFNHSRHSKASWTYVQTKEEVHDCITLTLHNSIGRDCQIFNSYGPKSNESLLASYGFVNETMEDDTVTIKLGNSDQKQKIAQSNTDVDQHYWQYGQPCPASLLEQVMKSIKRSADGEDQLEEDQDLSHLTEEQVEQFKYLMIKGEAMELIGEMASNKLKGLNSVKIDMGNLHIKVRPDVARNINIYRKGQVRVLKWAIEEAGREEEEVMKQIDDLMQE